MTQTSYQRATADEIAAVEGLLSDRGLARTIALLGISRQTIDRIRGGLPVQRSTMLAARAALGLLAAEEPRP